MSQQPIIIGGASGFWGEASHAAGQLIGGGVDFLVFDYLAEITMSIMARARMADETKGYATDFVTEVMARNAGEIAARGVKVLSNAGGVNPRACAAALREALDKAGVELSVAVVEGDDLMDRLGAVADEKEMFSGAAFPPEDAIASANAYLGAFPVARALAGGADIVITGRCADSALALAACIHAFGWRPGDHDLLAAGSLAGHLVECGPQATGGNFTDWRAAGDLARIGYPMARVDAAGGIEITKPEGTTGLVTRASVGEQLLYEIGDPRAYLLPDVACDFTRVTLDEVGPDRVRVSGARGRAPSGKYKVSVTWADGYRAGFVFQMNGREARAKARAFVRIGLDRAEARLKAKGAAGFREVSVETFGGRPGAGPYEEITVKVAVRHDEARAVGLFLKEEIGAALATPPGLHFFTGGGRPKPSPVVRLYSFLVDAAEVPVTVILPDGSVRQVAPPEGGASPLSEAEVPEPVAGEADEGERLVSCRLEELAWARSGDKGDSANIGVIARHPALMPWIWRGLTEARVAEIFADTLQGGVTRHYLPGARAMNIVLEAVLGGGGVASLMSDAQGKGFAQRLLNEEIAVPEAVLRQLKEGVTP